jgi:hypothetical protein
MTSGAAAAMQRKTPAIVNVARVIAPVHIILGLLRRAKKAESAGAVLGTGCRQTQQSRLEFGLGLNRGF